MRNTGFFSINGTYEIELNIFTMFNIFNIKLPIKRNLIVDNGLEFFLKRMIDNDLTIISKIALGTSTNAPKKTDTNLVNRTVTVDSVNSIELSEKRVKMVAHFNSSQVNGTSEIGVFTKNDRMISRNVHEPISVPSSTSMTINYYYSFVVGSYKYDWAKTTDLTNVYEITENVNVSSVLEEDTKNGYILKNSRADVDSTPSSYYYDGSNKKLYIHTSDSQTPNDNHLIVISY